ncbi:MAG: TPM domain-containing protein [Bacteroidetes bacterium]|nr:MAG: TPM domain-containing protein [Bacteroidota bacterium]
MKSIAGKLTPEARCSGSCPGHWGRFVFIFLLFSGHHLQAQVDPASLSMRAVSDYSDLLSEEEEASLSQRIIAYYDSSSVQMAVALIPAAYLGTYSAESYAYALATHWKLGTKADDSGLLILLVGKPGESNRSLRFEVGYGLEPVLTDATCYQIQQQVMVPRLKEGRFFEALREGLAAIEETLTLGELPFRMRAPAPTEEEPLSMPAASRAYLAVGVCLLVLSLVVWIALILIRRRQVAGLRSRLGIPREASFTKVYVAVVDFLKKKQNDAGPSKTEKKLLHTLLSQAYRQGLRDELSTMVRPYKGKKNLNERTAKLLTTLPQHAWQEWPVLVLAQVGMGLLMQAAFVSGVGDWRFPILMIVPIIMFFSLIAFGFAVAVRTGHGSSGSGGSYSYSSSGSSSYSSSSFGSSESWSSSSDSWSSSSDSYSGGGGSFGGGGASSSW